MFDALGECHWVCKVIGRRLQLLHEMLLPYVILPSIAIDSTNTHWFGTRVATQTVTEANFIFEMTKFQFAQSLIAQSERNYTERGFNVGLIFPPSSLFSKASQKCIIVDILQANFFNASAQLAAYSVMIDNLIGAPNALEAASINALQASLDDFSNFIAKNEAIKGPVRGRNKYRLCRPVQEPLDCECV